MKFSKKDILVTGLAVTLAAATIIGGGTFAYLQGTTEDVVNTFQTNKVLVELTETGMDANRTKGYSIIPGDSAEKDPKVTVDNTVDSYVYVEVTDTTEGLVTYAIAEGWTLLDGYTDVYYREVAADAEEKDFYVLKDNTVSYDAALENSDMLDAKGNLKDGIQLSFKAMAIQKEGFADAAAAYKRVPTEAATLEEVNASLAAGKDVKLTAKINNQTVVAKDGAVAALDLNGNDVAGIRMAFGNRCAIKAEGAGTVLTIEGQGLVDGRGYSAGTANAVKVESGAKVIINDGTYTTGLAYNGSPNSVILANGGTVEISGGFFYNTNNAGEWVLNCQDNTDSHIIVKGGTFVNFDPSNNASEGENTNYVAAGYHVEQAAKDNGDIWYTVVPV